MQQLERRINRMQGERSNEEKIHLEQKIKDLTDELDQKNNTHTLLTLQLKRLQVFWSHVYYCKDLLFRQVEAKKIHVLRHNYMVLHELLYHMNFYQMSLRPFLLNTMNMLLYELS